ncbi:MAG: DUF1641 domain-containing protein [Alicyclobacillus herbarius]|uniref:DUF1641 domain-containing protein n=1 Tax=Alicyclobacillus herbarius TaxID=122960 RepID=UPI0003F7716F|nr:DUF1641 domain-containing protein [Alicyclobacillus herbarius]MCL6633256.1 DUF1641 domain-containing protein [Alicyclobacillus herbarius]
MARPINVVERTEQTAERQQAEALQELSVMVAKHHDVLMEMLTVAKDLNDSGVFDILHGLLSAKERVAAIALEQALKPGVVNILKNAMMAIQVVASLSPDTLAALGDAALAGLEGGQQALERKGKPGLLRVMRDLRDPNVQRALTWLLGFLRGMGERLPS